MSDEINDQPSVVQQVFNGNVGNVFGGDAVYQNREVNVWGLSVPELKRYRKHISGLLWRAKKDLFTSVPILLLPALMFFAAYLLFTVDMFEVISQQPEVLIGVGFVYLLSHYLFNRRVHQYSVLANEYHAGLKLIDTVLKHKSLGG